MPFPFLLLRFALMSPGNCPLMMEHCQHLVISSHYIVLTKVLPPSGVTAAELTRVETRKRWRVQRMETGHITKQITQFVTLQLTPSIQRVFRLLDGSSKPAAALELSSPRTDVFPVFIRFSVELSCSDRRRSETFLGER